MNRELRFTPEAEANLKALKSSPAKADVLKQVLKTLGLLETNLRHPSLNTRAYASLHGPNDEEVFEAYAQNRTPGAYLSFFYYGPDRVAGKKRTPVLTIVAITPASMRRRQWQARHTRADRRTGVRRECSKYQEHKECSVHQNLRD
jgi:hypothetical protein